MTHRVTHPDQIARQVTEYRWELYRCEHLATTHKSVKSIATIKAQGNGPCPFHIGDFTFIGLDADHPLTIKRIDFKIYPNGQGKTCLVQAYAYKDCDWLYQRQKHYAEGWNDGRDWTQQAHARDSTITSTERDNAFAQCWENSGAKQDFGSKP